MLLLPPRLLPLLTHSPPLLLLPLRLREQLLSLLRFLRMLPPPLLLVPSPQVSCSSCRAAAMRHVSRRCRSRARDGQACAAGVWWVQGGCLLQPIMPGQALGHSQG